MSSELHLNNAPIKEAVIDFRVKLNPDFKVSDFSLLKDELKDTYPKVRERKVFEGLIKIGEGKIITPKVDSEINGYRYETKDGKNVAQFNREGFSFSRLMPYTEWESVFEEAKKLWELYVSTSKTDIITRIATRFINHIEFPLPISDLSEYLVSPPTIPDTLSKTIRYKSFLSKVVLRDIKSEILANVTQALERSIKSDHVILIFDIDVYEQKEYKVNDNSVWDKFEELHRMKNEIFFKSLTNKTIELYR